MKLALFGIQNIPLGKHNVKDPRLDQVHELVEADKKAYAQMAANQPKFAKYLAKLGSCHALTVVACLPAALPRA